MRQDASILGRYGYDAKGMRILKIGDDGVRRYSYDQLSVITEANEANATVSKYDYGLDQLVSLDNTSEGRSFFHLDILRSTVSLSNSTGSARQSIFYDAWGNERDRVGASANRFTFTGHEKDGETGLIYAKARFYDPDVGRFLNQDSLLGNIVQPPSLHRYAYVMMNPLRFFDANGLQSQASNDFTSSQLVTVFDERGTPVGSVFVVGRRQETVTVKATLSRSEKILGQTGRLVTPIADIQESAAIRTIGVVQAAGGAGQALLGGFAIATPEPTGLTKVAGTVAIVRGVDNIQAGLRQAITGQVTETATGTIVREGFELAGFDEEDAALLGATTELALDFGSTALSGRAVLNSVGGSGDDVLDDVLGDAADDLVDDAVDDGIDISLKRPPGVTDAQWQKKLDALNTASAEGRAKVVRTPSRSGRAQRQARREGRVEAGDDADHGLDLQFGGEDTVEEIISTNPTVNRSVGGQGRQRLQHPDGTPIRSFKEKP